MKDKPALFDPIWEYILDDYDEGDKRRSEINARRSQSQVDARQEPEADTAGLLDFFQGNNSTSENASNTDRRNAWSKNPLEKSSSSLLGFFDGSGSGASDNGIKKDRSWSKKFEETRPGFLLNVFDDDAPKSDTGIKKERSWSQKKKTEEKSPGYVGFQERQRGTTGRTTQTDQSKLNWGGDSPALQHQKAKRHPWRKPSQFEEEKHRWNIDALFASGSDTVATEKSTKGPSSLLGYRAVSEEADHGKKYRSKQRPGENRTKLIGRIGRGPKKGFLGRFRKQSSFAELVDRRQAKIESRGQKFEDRESISLSEIDLESHEDRSRDISLPAPSVQSSLESNENSDVQRFNPASILFGLSAESSQSKSSTPSTESGETDEAQETDSQTDEATENTDEGTDDSLNEEREDIDTRQTLGRSLRAESNFNEILLFHKPQTENELDERDFRDLGSAMNEHRERQTMYETNSIPSRDASSVVDVNGLARRRDFQEDEQDDIIAAHQEKTGGGPVLAQMGLRRMVCRSGSDREVNEIGQLDAHESRALFPAARLVSDNKKVLSSIDGHRADFVNGVMGMPSDRFVTARGPQSLYQYEYDTAEHMDIIYAEHAQNPRVSLFVRKLGQPLEINNSPTDDEVILQIEASTVSETDTQIRRGNWWGAARSPLPNIPGVDVVGKIHSIKQRTAKKFNLTTSQPVLSLVNWGGNSRYISIHPDQLVPVPKDIDPAEAVCLPETYLTAFQVLHFGQSGAARYKRASLAGKSLLIVGGMSNIVGKAIIELALNAGAADIYATAKKKHWKTLLSYGVMPLSQDPTEWISRVQGKIDLVLATPGPFREDISLMHYKALEPQGQLIKCGRGSLGNDMRVGSWNKQHGNMVCAKNKSMTRLLNRTHSYDVYDQWERCLDVCKKDLVHLLELLERGDIRPKVLDRIPLSKVSRAHEMLQSKQLSGFLVCEPWMCSKKRAIYL